MEQPRKMMMPIKEASVITGLSYSHIRRLCLEKRIVFIRSGTKYMINYDSLVRYCNQDAS